MSNSSEAETLRDQVWTDYYYKRQNQICSRCGDYNKYDIQEIKLPTERDLCEIYGHDFYTMEYKINTTRILTNKSLDINDGGNLCSKCRNHILGNDYYPLSSSLEDAEYEIRDMRQNERLRQIKQNDEIKELRKQFNKERRENDGKVKLVREIVNPNDREKEVEKL